MIAGWPAVIDAAKREGETPAVVAKAITARLPWHLLDGESETQRAAKTAFAVNQEARRYKKGNQSSSFPPEGLAN